MSMQAFTEGTSPMSNPTPTPTVPAAPVVPAVLPVETATADPTIIAAADTVEKTVTSRIPASVRVWLYPVLGVLTAAALGVAADPAITGLTHEIALAVGWTGTGFHTSLATTNVRD